MQLVADVSSQVEAREAQLHELQEQLMRAQVLKYANHEQRTPMGQVSAAARARVPNSIFLSSTSYLTQWCIFMNLSCIMYTLAPSFNALFASCTGAVR